MMRLLQELAWTVLALCLAAVAVGATVALGMEMGRRLRLVLLL